MRWSIRTLALVSIGLLMVGIVLFWYFIPFVCFSTCLSSLPLAPLTADALLLGPGVVGALVTFIAYQRYLLSRKLLRHMYISCSIVLAAVIGAAYVFWRTQGGALLPSTETEFGNWFMLTEAFALCIMLGLTVLSTRRLPSPRTN